MSTPDSLRDILLGQLADEFVERCRRGERPALSEFVERHPSLARDIRELFPALVKVEALKPAPGAPGGPGGEGAVHVRPLQRLGEFFILREIGRGAMGVVYEAEQETMGGRRVALKVLRVQGEYEPSFLVRFRNESTAAGRLHHTNIVPVFGVGECGGTHYYVMQYISGEPLDKVVRDLRRLRERREGAAGEKGEGPGVALSMSTGRFPPAAPGGTEALRPPDVPRDAGSAPTQSEGPSEATSGISGAGTHAEYCRNVARIVRQIAEGLDYAHRQGIVHRDIKPSNLLLDLHGMAWITDFGLVKMEGDEGPTQSGAIPGTLRYMGPERFEGKSLPQSDIYALGLTLYEMLTLRPAFENTDRLSLISQIMHEMPAPRKIDPRIPLDLETIVLKCAAKSPQDRYATAGALAEDLKLFLDDRPIRARRSSTAEQVRRWVRRNPLTATLSASLLLLLAVTAVGGVIMTLRLNASLLRAQQEEAAGKRKLFLSYLSDADATRLSRRPGQRFNSLRRVRDALEVGREIGLTDEDRLKLRNIAIAALCLPDLGAPEDVNLEERLAAETDPVHRRHLRAHAILKALPPPAYELHGTSWISPDGRFLAAAAAPYLKTVTVPVRIWRIDGERPVALFDDTTGVHEEGVAFRPDGRQVALGHADGAVTIWDLEKRARVRRLERGPGPVFCAAYHPRLPHLAVACGTEVAVWDVEAGKRLVRLPHPDLATAAAWHPRGHRLATAGYAEHQLYLWDIHTGRQVTPPWKGHKNGGFHLSFSHAGDRLVSNDWSHIVRLWDTASGELLLSRQANGIQHFAADGRSLLSFTPYYGSSHLPVAGGRELRVLRRQTPRGSERLDLCSLHPGGRLLAAKSSEGFSFIDLLTGEEVGTLAGNYWLLGAHFDSEGAFWTAGGAGGAGAVRWPGQASQSPHSLRLGPPEWITDLLVEGHDVVEKSDDGRVLLLPMHNGGARVIHRGPPRRTIRLGPQHDVRGGYVSNDGRWVATQSKSPDEAGLLTKLWEADTGRLIVSFPVDEVIGGIGFSPDSRWLYLRGKAGEHRVEIATLVAQAGGAAPGPLARPPAWRDEWKSKSDRVAGAFSPDNRVRAYGTSEGGIRLVSLETGQEIATIPPPTDIAFYPRQFTPDGTRLLALGHETQALYVFDLHLIRKQLAELGLDWDDVQPPLRRMDDLDPARAQPLRLEVIGAESGATRAAMAEADARRAEARLLLDPSDAEAHFRLGRALSVAGRDAEAHRRLTAALAIDPALEEALALRARMAWRLDRWGDAADDAGRYLATVPYDPSMRALRAKGYLAIRRFEDAAADYSALCKAFPGTAGYFLDRAECYEVLRKPALAIAGRERARKLGGRIGPSLNSAARLLLTGPPLGRDPARALELIQEALREEPNNPTFLITLGVVEYHGGRYREAAATLENRLAAGGGGLAGADLFVLARCHAKVGEREKAKARFDLAVRWVEDQKNLTEHRAAELKRCREEAAAVLREK